MLGMPREFDMCPLAAPVNQRWRVIRPPGHARWAFDLVGVDRESHRMSTRGALALLAGFAVAGDLHGWSRPVLAPADGLVAAATDGDRDRQRVAPLVGLPASVLVRPLRYRHQLLKLLGNYVILETKAGFVLLAHLRRDSVRVRPGDSVVAGQPLGLVGSSGNAVGPHLHFQVMNGHDPRSASVLPFRLRRYELIDGRTSHTVRNAPLPERSSVVDFGL